MKRTLFTVLGILTFLTTTWLILNLVLNSFVGKMPDNYEITFGYRTNDSNLDFVDSATIFTVRTGLKAKIAFPDLSDESYIGLFQIKNTDGDTLQKFDMRINKGVSGQIFNISAEDWPSGRYDCSYEVDGNILATNSFSLQ